MNNLIINRVRFEHVKASFPKTAFGRLLPSTKGSFGSKAAGRGWPLSSHGGHF
jgi:hypothetical protein